MKLTDIAKKKAEEKATLDKLKGAPEETKITEGDAALGGEQAQEHLETPAKKQKASAKKNDKIIIEASTKEPEAHDAVRIRRSTKKKLDLLKIKTGKTLCDIITELVDKVEIPE